MLAVSGVQTISPKSKWAKRSIVNKSLQRKFVRSLVDYALKVINHKIIISTIWIEIKQGDLDDLREITAVWTDIRDHQVEQLLCFSLKNLGIGLAIFRIKKNRNLPAPWHNFIRLNFQNFWYVLIPHNIC